MKRLISSSENVIEWTIVAHFEAADEDSLAADTEIIPLRNDEGNLDQQAVTQWNNFIDNVVSYIDYLDFEIVDDRSSDRSSSYSHYTSFYPVDMDGNQKTEYLVNFRISDHIVSHLKKNKRSQNSKQKYRLVAVTVNNETFETYEQALDYIEHQLDSLIGG